MDWLDLSLSLTHTLPRSPSLTRTQLEDAEQQLEFLKEIQTTIGRSADVPFLSALMASRKGAAAETAIVQLDEASQM
jgi:tetratricopeptide repeat protein 21B